MLTGASTEVAHQVVLVRGDAAPSRHVHLELSVLRETLRSGLSVPVTFRFRDAGPVTLRVPIRTYTDVPVDRVHEPSP